MTVALVAAALTGWTAASAKTPLVGAPRVETLLRNRLNRSPCRGVETAIRTARKPTDHLLQGDVDGDGRSDVVWLSLEQSLPKRCRYLLVVQTVEGRRYGTVVWQRLSEGGWLGPNIPKVTLLVTADSIPGAEIVVNVWNGASTALLALYGVHSEHLRRFSVARSPSDVPDTFVTGGNARIFFGLNCLSRGGRRTVVADSVAAYRDRYELERQLYVARGFAFLLRSTIRETVERLPKTFGRPLFKSCIA